MIVPVDQSNLVQAAEIHSVSWQDSHRSFCSADFIALHTPQHQQEYLAEKIRQGSKVYMLLEDEPVGIVSLTGSLIEDLYILPNRQNKGYGSTLLKYALSLCQDTPTLWILENNVNAGRLYRRMGFRETGNRNNITEGLDEIEFALVNRQGEKQMKTIGLIGGMSWESTIPYYRIINEKIKESLGGLHSARIILYSVEFAEIEACQASGEWDRSAEILGDAAVKLEAAGADFIVICTNTMHKVAPQIQAKISVPVVHIADATADRLETAGIRKVALLGTKYTMTQDFYKSRLIDRGFEVLIPDAAGVETVNSVIYEELCLGIIKEESRVRFSQIIAGLKAQGAEAVILGCTEIGLLVQQENSVLPVFDTTEIHALRAAELALQD